MLKKMFGGGPKYEADWLVVGLGNPGPKYARTRHNVGWWAIDELAKRWGVQLKADGANVSIGRGQLEGVRIALVKPRTYVNQSGRAVRQAQDWTGCDAPHTVVVYDDLDLGVGALRVRAGGGTGGHNGLKSIVAATGAEFVRVRIGIGRPSVHGEPSRDPEVVADFVLSDPTGEERRRLEEVALLAADAVETVIRDGVEAASQRYTRK
jgi:PTH1 family peptidyl-tRNA hydrolase